MRRAGAHSCLNFFTEFLLCFVFGCFLLISCSSARLTALHLAAFYGHKAACQLLISAEADVNAKNMCAFMFKFVTEVLLCFFLRYFLLIFFSSSQRTALHNAADKGHTAACQLLISAEADVNATGWCAFMFKICY
jgi:ankyrin repeat protein